MDAIRKHIKVEFSASLQYLMMAAHFAQDTINLNGFAQLFFKRWEKSNVSSLFLLRTKVIKANVIRNTLYVVDMMFLHFFFPFFFHSANEERAHGIQFLDYIKMRGDATVDLGINSLAPILGKSRYIYVVYLYVRHVLQFSVNVWFFVLILFKISYAF